MGYLYLNFLENMNQGSKSWDDFYTSSYIDIYEYILTVINRSCIILKFVNIFSSQNDDIVRISF